MRVEFSLSLLKSMHGRINDINDACLIALLFVKKFEKFWSHIILIAYTCEDDKINNVSFDA